MKLIYHKSLDGVRAIAALMVMVFHFFSGTNLPGSEWMFLKKIAVFGQTGVTLFFVLSGFLITRILLESKSLDGYFKNFYFRRVFRIFPLYYFFLLIFYFGYPVIFGAASTPFNQQFFYYTYLQNFATTFHWNAIGPDHFWSLAVEEHFYLFWPFVVYFLTNKQLLYVIIGIVLGALALRVYMLTEHFDVFYFTFTRFDALAIGALLSLLEIKSVFTSFNARKFLFVFVGVLIPTIAIWTFVSGTANVFIQVIKYLLLAIAYFGLIGYVLCLKKEHPIGFFTSSKFMVFTGKISYGLYVYHPFAYRFTKVYIYTGHWMVELILGFCLTYLIAWLSFQWLESPFLKLKKHFTFG